MATSLCKIETAKCHNFKFPTYNFWPPDKMKNLPYISKISNYLLIKFTL